MTVLEDVISNVDDFEVRYSEYIGSPQEAIVINDLKVLHNDIYKSLNYSILNGSYIKENDFISRLTQLDSSVKKILESFALYENIQNVVLDVVQSVNFSIETFKIFTKDKLNKYSSQPVDYLFSINLTLSKSKHAHNFSDDSNELINYFDMNIKIADFDHYLSDDTDQYVQIYRVLKELESFSISGFTEITKLILIKINFLKLKWIIRKQEHQSHVILIDGIEEQVSEEDAEIYYSHWATFIKEHYEIYTNWQPRVENTVRPLVTSDISTLPLKDIHRLIKYYKDVLKNQEKLNEISVLLLDQFKLKSRESSTLSFDVYAYLITSNYAINNQYSLFIEGKTDIDEIKKKYEELKGKRNPGIYNFFLEFKYLGAIIDLLIKKVENEGNIEFINKYEKFVINECKRSFEQYAYNNKWSINHHNYIFQLPFDECLIKVEHLKVDKLFIASSIVLPPSKNKIEDQFYSIKTKFENLLTHINTIKGLKSDLLKIQEIKKDVSDQKAEIKSREIKSMEILGLFTALVTFVLGSISTFKFIENAWQALLFVIALSMSLIFFVLILFLLNRGQRVIQSHRGALIITFIATFLFWGGIIYFHDSDLESTKVLLKKYQTKTDSLINFKMDSIQRQEGITKNIKKK